MSSNCRISSCSRSVLSSSAKHGSSAANCLLQEPFTEWVTVYIFSIEGLTTVYAKRHQTINVILENMCMGLSLLTWIHARTYDPGQSSADMVENQQPRCPCYWTRLTKRQTGSRLLIPKKTKVSWKAVGYTPHFDFFFEQLRKTSVWKTVGICLR